MLKEKAVTNEKLIKNFTSPFNLVNYAVTLAKDISLHGEERSNLANYVIELIASGKDHLVEKEIEEDEIEKEEKNEKKETGV